MGSKMNIDSEEVKKLYRKLLEEASNSGYYVNPDEDMAIGIVEGLLSNEKRDGYMRCPCRLGDGSKELDIDIICPCDYRDADIEEYGNCYCSLYVSSSVAEGESNIQPIPERRPSPEKRKEDSQIAAAEGVRVRVSSEKVWRCRVCGYLCARENPPAVCPICKAKKERFEEFAI